MPNSSIRIDLTADLAPAAYFVMAGWQNPSTAPCLDTGDRPLKLLIEPSSEALDELRQTIRRVGQSNSAAAPSALALLAEVERQATAAAHSMIL